MRKRWMQQGAVLLCAAALVAMAGAAYANDAAGTKSGWAKRLQPKAWFPNPPATRYMPPLTNTVFNETPEITTELRTYYLYNKVPSDFFTSGGNVHVVGVQSRLALTDRIGLYVSKAGYASASFDELLPDDAGALNVAFGAKYAILAHPERSTFLTAGLRYETPSGSIRSGQVDLQGGGDGFLDPFLSFGARVGERTSFQSSAGFNLALDGDHDSSAFHYAVHVDFELFENLYGLIEANLLATISEGDRTPGAVLGSFEGYDLFNFGNTDSGTVMTAGFGARYRIGEHVLAGLGFEVPLPGRQDLVGFRALVDLIAYL